MYRKFSLTNSNNTTWELTNPDFEVFGTNPSGLGFATDTSFLRVGNDNLLTYSQWTMVEKSMDIMFFAKTLAQKYKMYNDFIKFLIYEPIYLLYETPNSSRTYRIKVKVSSLGKTEVDPSNSCLVCPITMIPMSFWEDNISNVIVVSNAQEGEGKAYPLQRPYYYSESNTSNILLKCDGTLPSPLQITIDGTTTDPQYSLYNEANELYGIGKFIGTYSLVYVNSDEADESIALETNGAPVSNPYNYQDLTIGSPDMVGVTFLRLNPLSDNRLAFNLSSDFDGTVTIEWRNRYLSV